MFVDRVFRNGFLRTTRTFQLTEDDVPSFYWTRREFLEIALKTGAGVTASAAAFGSQGQEEER
jgi:hypothetical protein